MHRRTHSMLLEPRAQLLLKMKWSTLLLCSLFVSSLDAFSPCPRLHRATRLASILGSTIEDDITTQVHREESSRFTTTLKQPNYSEQVKSEHMNSQDEADISVLALPQWLEALQNGEALYAHRQNDNQHAFSLERVSMNPPIFVLRNFLSHQECNEIQQSRSHSQPAQTLNGQGSTARPNCHVSWMEYDEIATDVAILCIDPSFDVWVEKLQLLKYTQDGKYVLHHDGHKRVLTCLYYLNGVGGTWFPLANNKEREPRNREEALAMCQDCIPGREGLLLVGNEVESSDVSSDNKNVIRVQAGDALVFYSYRLSPDDEALSDWRTLHAGMPSPHVKMIANHWFHLGDNENKE